MDALDGARRWSLIETCKLRGAQQNLSTRTAATSLRSLRERGRRSQVTDAPPAGIDRTGRRLISRRTSFAKMQRVAINLRQELNILK